MSKLKGIFIFIILFILVSMGLFTQSGRSIITGKILSDEGIAVQGVRVIATSPELIGDAHAVSDKKGGYLLFNLPRGAYKIRYESEGFKTIIKENIFLNHEVTLNLPIRLVPVNSNKIDKDKILPLDVKSTMVQKTIPKETFNKLPKGRDFTTMSSIIPGINYEPSLSGISIGGASGSENKFYIDGVDVTDIRTGFQGQRASFDFIDLVQVKSSGFMAEYGGASGGVINAVTKSGGNEFHGDVLAYYSGSALSGTLGDILSLDSYKAVYLPYSDVYGDLKENRIEAGFSLGGYILKDKVWFFGSFLPEFTKYTNKVEYQYPEIIKIHETREKDMNFMLKISAKLFKNISWSATYLNNYYSRIGGSVPLTYSNGIIGLYNEDYDESGYDAPNFSASTSLDISFEKSFLNIRGGLFYTNRKNPQKPIPNIPYYNFQESVMGGYSRTDNLMFPEIPTNLQHLSGWRSGGFDDSQALIKSIVEKKSISADYTLYFNLLGEHSLKIGGQFIRQGEDVDNGWQQPMIYLGWDRSAIENGIDHGRGEYGYYVARGTAETGKFGDVYKAYSNKIALYLQDSWTIGERLTINYGIRIESEYLPSYSDNPDYVDVKPIKYGFGDKLVPRFGFVYDIKGDSSMKIFGSYGIFFDALKLEKVVDYFNAYKWKDVAYTLDDWDFTKIGVDGYYPGELLYMTDFRTPSYDYIDKDLKPVSVQNISIGLEKKISDDLLFSLNILNKHLRHGIKEIYILTPVGPENFITNPGYGVCLINENWQEVGCGSLPTTPKSKREYWSLTASLDKRFSNNWMGGISYRWSRLTGNYIGNELPLIEDIRSSVAREGYSWWQEFDKELIVIDGVLSSDRTHIIKAYSSYLFPFGLTLGTVINIMSGTPVTEEWKIGNILYPYNRGNLGRTPILYKTDLYAEYNLKLGKTNLQFSINIENIFNFKIAQDIYSLKNFGNLYITDAQILSGDWDYPNDATPDSRFMQPYNYTPPISARVGMKLSF